MVERHFGVIALPTVLFLNVNSKEIPNLRIVGEISASKFLNHLKQLQVGYMYLFNRIKLILI
ncbi:hypothetical protein B1F79_04355 [Coxiella-like endosymbiont of Rhipicephalus sanguineus]|nr:hypothetical protein [Coxiella-like endosymbiont of Rhipicephalus sanguineus]